jgi:hypothetical protein
MVLPVGAFSAVMGSRMYATGSTVMATSVVVVSS